MPQFLAGRGIERNQSTLHVKYCLLRLMNRRDDGRRMGGLVAAGFPDQFAVVGAERQKRLPLPATGHEYPITNDHRSRRV